MIIAAEPSMGGGSMLVIAVIAIILIVSCSGGRDR
jgi:hypothetical protein